MPTEVATADLDLEVVEALIASQDQLAALRALIGVPIDSLDDNNALESTLHEALELTDSQCAVFVRGELVMEVGTGAQLVELRERLTSGANLTRTEPHPVEFLLGGAQPIDEVGHTGRHLFGRHLER